MSVVGVAAPVAAVIIASAEVSCSEENAGSKEFCEFTSLLNYLGMRIQGWGFSTSA